VSLPIPTLAWLAQFTGRPEASYTQFAEQALQQATLLFSMTTGVRDYPDDDDLKQLAVNAILEMADAIYLEQPNAQINASPFASETIGSYSYSRTAANASTIAARVEPTGLFWWDLAVANLSTGDQLIVDSGSIRVIDHTDIRCIDGEQVIVNRADLLPALDVPYDVNAEVWPRR
jgi:hypothetical protein